MAQPSSSAAANSDHDVFINHRGPDAKKTFASHLYNRLSLHGLRVFLDDPELRRGDDFSVQIINAIGSASVHVAIFSPGYADSHWCLKELVEMLDTKAPIIPVFYHVKPDELRGTRGKEQRTYAEALDDLASKTDYDGQTPRHDPSKIQKWKEALRQVANISGFELEACNGDEGELLEKLVVEVLKRVKKLALDRDVPKDAPGLDEKVTDFEFFLLQRQQSEKPRILGIVGLGGIGKTTLATEFFNRKTSDYSGSCFFSNVKDAVGNHLISLQKKLLGMLNVTDEKIKRVTDVAEGKALIRKHLSSYKALVVIDDVDHVEQVDALLPHQSVIHPDSLILITSRNRDVLRNSNVEEESIYTLTGLSKEHSLELFCSHSFNQSYPPQEFEFLVNKFEEACGGLPLSLKVVGARLRGKNKYVWEEELSKPLPSGIKQILQVSYNALEEEEKEIFLDIATFFIGEDRDRVIRIVGESGFQNIVDRCLVDVDREKRIKMHDHVRDMGRQLAKGSGLPRRLFRWTEEDNDYLLRKSLNRQMTDVRGVRIVVGEVVQEEDYAVLCDEYTEVDDDIRMSGLQFLDAEGDLMERILTKVSSPNLKWLRWTESECSTRLPYSLPRSIPMKNLRVLQIEGDRLKTLWEEEVEPPLQLRELEVKAPLSDIPESLGLLNHLERIVISYDCNEYVPITKLPEEFCFLRSLKVLVLWGWSRMKELPKCFGNLTELQDIQLSSCTALHSLPESFGNLTNLHHLQLSKCSALKRLPDLFGDLVNLQNINLNGCSSLQRLPNSFRNLKNLRHLDLSKCSNLEMLPYSFGNLRNLQYINLSKCSNLQMLPNSLGNLKQLQYMNLSWCSNFQTLPNSFGNLRNLRHIDVSWCSNLQMLPNSFGNLTNLQHINLSGCSNLPILPNSFGNLIQLKHLYLGKCYELSISNETLGQIRTLESLEISGCYGIEVLPPQITNQRFLREMYLFCPFLRELPSAIGELNHLEILHLESSCLELLEMGELVSLEELQVRECVNLKSIQGLAQMTKLRRLHVANCSALKELSGVEHLMSLEKLNATNCPNLQWGSGVLEQLAKQLKGCIIE